MATHRKTGLRLVQHSPMRSRREESALERGVLLAPYKANGAPILVAITSAGDRLTETIVSAGIDVDEAIAQLWRMLDTFDAPAASRLRIVP